MYLTMGTHHLLDLERNALDIQFSSSYDIDVVAYLNIWMDLFSLIMLYARELDALMIISRGILN